MSQLYIIGSGGHGAVVAELAAILGYDIAGFIDDNPDRIGAAILQWRVLGGRECIPAGASVALGVGDNAARLRLVEEAAQQGWHLPTLIHPTAVVSPSAVIGEGTVILAQALVHTRGRVGRGCILNTGSAIDHDCTLGDGGHISPGVRTGGGTTIGTGTHFGVSSCTRPCVTVGAWSVIGAGAVVVSDIPDGVIAFGNPARVRTPRVP